jgi:tRNA-splicing ligase RtcB
MPIDGTDIIDRGIPEGPLVGTALAAAYTLPEDEALEAIERAWTDPDAVLKNDAATDALRDFARAVQRRRERQARLERLQPLDEPQPYTVYGRDLIDDQALGQMDTAMRLPIARKGALMPDAHVGYGLPVGGVLACENAVIPYAVGVDIACRMMVSVFPEPWRAVKGETERLANAIEEETAFGAGSGFQTPRQHPVMDDPRWNELPFVGRLREKARHQLGSSGGGNHFVEWGTLTLTAPVDTDHGSLEPGEYVALMSHSGSRGFGFQVCQHYKDVAQDRCAALPDDMRHLSWLSLDEASGQDYWQSMQLAGDYASANHHLIHQHVAKAARLKPTWQVEHHHNFAWKEEHNGQTLYVHRKGATPAEAGQLGIIPGSMGDRGVIVRGKGTEDALRSCAHGAGRVMSRTKAKQTLTRSDQKKYLAERGVTLLSGGLDESPRAYKRIDDVLAAQDDLVDVIATFQPKIVKMADD